MVKMVRSDVVAITGFIFCLLFAHSEGAACMECTNYINGVENNNCPISGPVPYIATAFISCTGFCFQRTFASDPKLIARGCTTSLTGLPEIIPPPNCYDWEGALFCVCSTPLCNIKALGTSTGMSLDYLVAGSKPVSTSAPVSGGQSPTAPVAGGQSPAAPVTAATTALTSTATPTTTRSSATSTKAPIPTPRVVNYPIQCIDCRNYFNSTYYSWCPGNGSAVISQVYSGDCQGPCFTRSDINDKLLVVRGCTASQMTFPKPLPAHGCYTWNDATVCVCYTSNCNLGPIGVSSNVQLDAHLTDVQPAPGSSATSTKAPTLTPRVVNYPIQCIDCRNYFNSTYYSWCPGNGSAVISQVYSGDCQGPCFTRSDINDKLLVVRGCTASQMTFPKPLPADGCYTWNDATVCVCSTSNCNLGPIGVSSNVQLDAHLIDVQPAPGAAGDPLQCYECMNYNVDGTYVPQCPKDGRVNSQTVFYGNCTGACFTKTFKNDPRKVGRGCTQSQYGVPYPLPPSGCYTYSDETWCICSTPGCNGGPIDISSGVEFDEHLNVLENVVELDGINRCYQCLSFSDGVYYPQCPRNSRVKNAFLAPCNGTCFTRTYDKDERVISRGCTTSQWGLPNPLPPDGCYTWYTEIWCLCSTSRCNGAALGIPQNREIDDHLRKAPGGQRSVKDNIDMFVLPFLAITCILKMFFHV